MEHPAGFDVPGRPLDSPGRTGDRSIVRAIGLLLLLVVPGPPAAGAGDDATASGRWVGSFLLAGQVAPIEVRITSAAAAGGAETLHGRLVQPFARFAGELDSVTLADRELRFTWHQEEAELGFTGRLEGDRLAGVVTRGDQRGTLVLERAIEQGPQDWQRIAGLYELSPDHLLAIAVHPQGPVYVDFTTGRTGFLFPRSPTVYFGGPSILLAAPAEVTFELTRDAGGEVSGLVRRDQDGEPAVARRQRFRHEEVTIRNGDVRLAGTLVLPVGVGPHPAVLHVGGAGPSTRRTLVDELYAYYGVAYLGYDKRGAGESSGDWRTVGVDELASDAVAAYRALAAHSGVDPHRVGLEGASEGGWVVARAAASLGDPAFLVLLAGPVLSYADELRNETEDHLRLAGFTGEQLARAIEFRTAVQGRIASGQALTAEGWRQVQEMAAAVGDQPWFPWVRPAAELGWQQHKLARMLPFDPGSFWEHARLPVLAIYGENDHNVPAAANVAALEGTLERAGNRDHLVLVVPHADHEGLESESGSQDEIVRQDRYAPGYLTTPIEWIRRHVERPGRAAASPSGG